MSIRVALDADRKGIGMRTPLLLLLGLGASIASIAGVCLGVMKGIGVAEAGPFAWWQIIVETLAALGLSDWAAAASQKSGKIDGLRMRLRAGERVSVGEIMGVYGEWSPRVRKHFFGKKDPLGEQPR